MSKVENWYRKSILEITTINHYWNHYQKLLPKSNTENYYQKSLQKMAIKNHYQKSLSKIATKNPY